jgi:Uma2 family endonuclease
VAVGYQPYRFTRDQFYAIADTFDPQLRYELLDGTIYQMSPAKPPHAGVVTFFENRFSILDRTKYLVRTEKALEIEPDGAPEPDIAVVDFRADYYGASHPSGSNAKLIIEVGDTERKPREKMRAYMNDGRIPIAWRVDLPNRSVEIWKPLNTNEPDTILFREDRFEFAGVTFTVDEVFQTVLRR